MKTNSPASCWKWVVDLNIVTVWPHPIQTSSLGRYSVGYFYQPDMTLDEAQLAKMEMIGRKLDLKPGILDKSGCQHVEKKIPLCLSILHECCGLVVSILGPVDLAQTSKSRVPSCSQEFVKDKRTFLASWSLPLKQKMFKKWNRRSSNFQPTQNLPGFNLYISLLGLFSKVWSFWRLVLVLAAWPIFWPPSTMSRSRQWHCPKHRWYPGSQRRVVDFDSFERCFRAEIVRLFRIYTVEWQWGGVAFSRRCLRLIHWYWHVGRIGINTSNFKS